MSLRRYTRQAALLVALWLPRAHATAGPATGSAADLDAVRELIERGRYSEATRRAEELGRSHAPAPPGAATDLLVQALTLDARGHLDATWSLARGALETKERLLGPEHAALAPSLRNLGLLHANQGQWEDAIRLYRRALGLAYADTDEHWLDRARTLDELGWALTKAGRYDEAETALRQAAEAKEGRLGPRALSLATTYERLGYLAQERGDYARERPLLERALRLRQSAPLHPDLAVAYDAISYLLWFEGRLAESRDAAQIAVAITERTLGPTHLRTARYVSDVGDALEALGDLRGARETQERAYRIALQALGPDDPEMGMRLNSLGNVSLAQGDYVAARRFFEAGLEVLERRLGARHAYCATLQHGLALTYARLGDFPASLAALDRAIASWETIRGADHPFTGMAVETLGEVLASEGRYAEAVPLFRRALAIKAARLQSGHREIARSLANLAGAVWRLGASEEALADARRALALWEAQAAGTEDPELARTLQLLARMEIDRGDAIASRAHAQRALEIRERTLGSAHPAAAESREVLARALFASGARAEALDHALAAEEAGREHLRLTIRSLPERQALGYAAIRPAGRDLALSILLDSASGGVLPPDASARVLGSVIRSRALVLDEMAARQRLVAAGGDEAVSRMGKALSAARERLAALIVAGPRRVSVSRYGELLATARREKDLAEQALAAGSEAFRDELTRDRLGLDELLRALPELSALVSFVSYEDRASQAVSYAAFVVQEGRAPVAIPLGPAAQVEALVRRWRSEAASAPGATADSPGAAERRCRAAGDALRRRVWHPLAAHLDRASRVFVVPDGALSLVAFAALPQPGGAYLVEEGPELHYLSAERDLLPARPGTQGRGLIALGGAAFGAPTTPPDTTPPAERVDCGWPERGFAPLPASTREVAFVASLWPQDATLLTGAEASESQLKKMAPGHRVLHLATHAFASARECPTSGSGDRILAENPLLGSGLAFSGANERPDPSGDDGILTAEEVSALNLEGVEWAVLSACDSGLGQLRAGEGVFGLRRAFQVAGVQTVIMSLWPVEDEAAFDWMKRLYEARLTQRLDTVAAVTAATLGGLRERRRKGENTHPFYWAAFVAAGGWR